MKPLPFISTVAVVVLVANVALAHGAAPATLGVASDDGRQPNIMLLSRGLATALDADSWRFVCGATWNGPEAPLALSADGQTTWIVGNDDIYALPTGGLPIGVDFPLPTWMVRRLRSAGSSVYGIVTLEDGSEVYRLLADEGGGQAERLWQNDTRHVTLDSDGVVLQVAGFADDELVIATLDLDGTPLDEVRIALDGTGVTPSLRLSGGETFVALTSANEYSLSRLDGDELIGLTTSEEPIHGPVTTGSETWVVTAGTLYRLDETLVLADDQRRHTCLDETASGTWICAQRALFPLTDEGVVDTPVFLIDYVVPPDSEGMGFQQAQACQAEWLDFAIDAGLPLSGPDDEEVAASDDGCSCAQAQPQAHLAQLLLWLATIGGLTRGRRYSQ